MSKSTPAPKADTGGWSTTKQNRVGEKLAAGLVATAVKYANAHPDDNAAQALASGMSDDLTAYRRTN